LQIVLLINESSEIRISVSGLPGSPANPHGELRNAFIVSQAAAQFAAVADCNGRKGSWRALAAPQQGSVFPGAAARGTYFTILLD